MKEYAVCVLSSGDDVSPELLGDGLFTVWATSGVNAIQGFINKHGMAYQSEMVAFTINRIHFCPPLCSDDIAMVRDVDYWRVDDANSQIVAFTSVCTVVQTEFPF